MRNLQLEEMQISSLSSCQILIIIPRLEERLGSSEVSPQGREGIVVDPREQLAALKPNLIRKPRVHRHCSEELEILPSPAGRGLRSPKLNLPVAGVVQLRKGLVEPAIRLEHLPDADVMHVGAHQVGK